MTTEWLYRVNVIAPAALTDLLNALWTIIAPEDDAEARSFGVPLSPSGQEPATHSGISTAATEEMMLAISQIFADELADCTVSVQNYTENNWQSLIASVGLKVVQVKL